MNDPFKLPRTGAEHPPVFTSARACQTWLTDLAGHKPLPAQAALLAQLNQLNRYDLPAAERLKILEQLREPVTRVQREVARKFSGRPMPLAPGEKSAFDAGQALWEAMRIGYLHCLQAALDGDKVLLEHAAPIAQRALSAIAAQQLDFLCASHEAPTGLWRTLHAIWWSAERLGITDKPVLDPLQPELRKTTVKASYALPILLHGASPYGLTLAQVLQMQRWLLRWAAKVQIASQPPAESRLRPVALELDADLPGTFMPDGVVDLRWLDVTELARGIRKRVLLLQQGESPESLRLGPDTSAEQCEHLLMHLYRHCCSGGYVRLQPRRRVERSMRVVIGAESVLHLLAGRVAQADDETRPCHVENWQLFDESANGMRLHRAQLTPGERVTAGQLLAVADVQEGRYMLASVRWVMMGTDGTLRMGTQLVPGQPKPVSLRRTGVPAGNEPVRAGFLLPPIEALNRPSALVLPAEWFRPARQVELLETATAVRLTRLVERGVDYDLVEFETA